MTPILDVSRLTKRYEHFMAVDAISFAIQEGEIVGLLGPNGAGKTTTMQMLLGLTLATSGTIKYFGREFPKHREYVLSRINFASAYSQIQGRLTVMQNFRIISGLYQVNDAKNRIQYLLSLLEIEDFAHTLFWKLSSGQKTRVMLAKALLNQPRLILMDEPTASLDPDIADKVLKLIMKLQKKEKTTILITSHNMVEVEEMCDRVIFLDHGHIVAEDTPLGLTKRIGTATLVLTYDAPQEKVVSLMKAHGFVTTYPRTHVVRITLPETAIPKMLLDFNSRSIEITDIDIRKPKLDDVFVSIARGKYAR